MQNATVATNSRTNNGTVWQIPVFIMMIVQVATAALILGLFLMLSWTQCALVLFSGGALTGGIVFTIATMQRLSRGE
jgi:hypothetical protein